jgi:hypothetical protein
VRAISASDLPLRRTLTGHDHEVVYGAAETNADHEPQQSRQKTKLRAAPGPINGPAPEIAAKWCPNKTHLFVG